MKFWAAGWNLNKRQIPEQLRSTKKSLIAIGRAKQTTKQATKDHCCLWLLNYKIRRGLFSAEVMWGKPGITKCKTSEHKLSGTKKTYPES